MFNSFRLKILLPVVALFLCLLVFLIVLLSVRFTAFSSSMEHDNMIQDLISLQYYLDISSSKTRSATLSVEHEPDLAEAIVADDRDAMLNILNGVILNFNIDFAIITDLEGNVLLRSYDPENYGDSIFYQANIKNAANGHVTTYAEEGTNIKVSIRTGGPIRNADNEIIALISSGNRFDTQESVSLIKRVIDTEITVFLKDTRLASTIEIAGKTIEGTSMDEEVYDTVFDRKEVYTGLIQIGDEEFYASYVPFINSDGQVFAAIATSRSNAPFSLMIEEFSRTAALLGFAILVFAFVVLYFIISTISKPLVRITEQMDLFSDGEIDIKIETSQKDEVGRLGIALEKSTNAIRDLIQAIDVMILDQKTGSTNIELEELEFKGAYLRIANGVKELTGMSMYDQLTKLPNRRTFDNRLEWEWSRAEREHSPIGVLMLDIDHFKNYNDSFGHQQGDVALITVAKALRKALQRKTDFVARWGGEEFVVLLPNTSKEGAVKVGEKIRSAIETTKIECDDEKGQYITISIGAYSQDVTENSFIDQFVHKADDGLYVAKETGRNRVCLPRENGAKKMHKC